MVSLALPASPLVGSVPVLPPGCVADVELEAKDLLSRLVGTAGDVAVAGYRVLRTDLGRRPTPTEVLHAGYKPLVASARHDHWFDFCSSEGDLAADEQAAATRFSASPLAGPRGIVARGQQFLGSVVPKNNR